MLKEADIVEYNAKLNIDHGFIKTLGVSMMGTVKKCPDWCV